MTIPGREVFPRVNERGSTFFKFIAIWFFAGAIVAIGAHELHTRYFRKLSTSKAEARKLVQELHGNIDIAKISASPNALRKLAEEQKTSETAKAKFDWKILFRRLVPETAEERVEKGEEEALKEANEAK